MKRLMMLMVMAVSLVGCAGSVNGTVGGLSMSVADSIFAVLKDSSGKTQGLFVLMSDKPKVCDSLKANRQPKSLTSVSMVLFRTNDTDFLAPDVGDYTVSDGLAGLKAGSHASANFGHTDSNCTDTQSGTTGTGKSGLIKLSALKAETNGVASGTLDVTFGSGDKVTGSFNATFCDISSVSTLNCE